MAFLWKFFCSSRRSNTSQSELRLRAYRLDDAIRPQQTGPRQDQSDEPTEPTFDELINEAATEAGFSTEIGLLPSSRTSPKPFQWQQENVSFSINYPDDLTEQEAVLWLVQHSRGFWIDWNPNHREENTEDEPIPLTDVTIGVFKTSDQFLDLIATEEKKPKAKLNKLYFKLRSEKKSLEVHWQKKNGNFILEIPLKSLGRTITVHGKGSSVQLFLHVTHPPLVYYSKDDHADLDQAERVRTNKLGSNIPIDILGDVEAISLSCTGTAFKRLQSCLQEEGYRLRFTFAKILDCDKQQEITNMIQIQRAACSFTHANFDVMYMMHALLSRGYKSIGLFVQIRELLRTTSAQVLPKVVANLQEAVKLIEGGIDIFLLNPSEVLQRTNQSRKNQRNLVRTCRITPTRVLLDEAQRVPPNRLFHEFHQEDFLRVSLIDDNGEPLSHIRGVDEENVYDEWICKRLTQVNLTGVTYDFVGCSNSQIKEHGCYMYKPPATGRENNDSTRPNTASDIRKWVGDLEKIRCVPKYMARFGLALSSLKSAPKFVKREWMQIIPDVEGGKDSSGKPYVFTDGVGRISKEAMAYVAKGKIHSAIQIRLGGMKGVLCLDLTLGGKQIQIRDSMIKFDSSQWDLGIQDVAKKKSLKLNRQVITILNQLDVDNATFLALQEKYLCESLEALFDEALAWKDLRQFSIIKKETMADSPTADKLCMRLLRANLTQRISTLKKKAQIPLPMEKARNMMGVADESGKLQYGEVFVYGSGQDKPLEREVLVTKMPCVHPGDVRKFKAVDVPDLHHLRDVIVFPIKGPRPHPNEMAGSDLDGDEYFVCWLDDLLFPGDNRQAMDFPPAKAQELDRPVQVDDMIKYLKDSILNDQMGILYNFHTKHADYQKEGVLSEICLELCDVLAKTVDGAKTGYRPVIKKEYHLKQTPDFMGKGSTYESTRALGHLFRQAKNFEDVLKRIPASSEQDFRASAGVHRIYAWERFHESMQHLKAKYHLQEDIEVLACRMDSFDKRQDLGRDLNDTFKQARENIARCIDDRSFQDSCSNLMSKSESALVLAFGHLCLQSGMQVKPVNKPATSKSQKLLGSIRAFLPNKLGNLLPNDLSKEDIAILLSNPWALLTAMVLAVKTTTSVELKTEAIKHFFSLAKSRGYFKPAELKETSLSGIAVNFLKQKWNPHYELEDAYGKIRPEIESMGKRAEGQIKACLLHSLLHVYLQEEYHKKQGLHAVLQEIKRSLCQLLENTL